MATPPLPAPTTHTDKPGAQNGHKTASLFDTSRVARKKPQGKLWRCPALDGTTITLPDDACEVS
jgi:hypothetical protein